MPAEDKPLPPILLEEEVQGYVNPSDIVAQVREATYSPSPLVRILQDPSILPPDTPEYATRPRERRRPSRSPRREHRAEAVAAFALAEEERQAWHLKSLLRSSGDRLEYEIRRADAATSRAEIAERQERDSLARAKAAEAEKEELREASVRLERDMRNYQTQLEAAQREMKGLQADLQDARREMEELQDSEATAQATVTRYRNSMHEFQLQMRKRDIELQEVLNKWYNAGKDDGFEEGFEEGHEAGRKIGVKEGVKKGRREGVKEGIEKGKHEERRNAIEAFDRFLAEEMEEEDRPELARQWAQTIYNPGGYSESQTLGPLDSSSAVG